MRNKEENGTRKRVRARKDKERKRKGTEIGDTKLPVEKDKEKERS